MSTSQESDSPQNAAEAFMQFFGIDHIQADAFLERVNERFIQPYAEFVNALSKALTSMFECLDAFQKSIEEKIAAEPEIPGHERLLIETLGYSPFGAKFMARLFHHWGELQADEINEGRRLRAIMDQIAKANGRSTLVISRRTKRFRDSCNSLEAGNLIDGAVRKAGLPSTATEFNQLVALACERDKPRAAISQGWPSNWRPICLKSVGDQFPPKPAPTFICCATSKAGELIAPTPIPKRTTMTISSIK